MSQPMATHHTMRHERRLGKWRLLCGDRSPQLGQPPPGGTKTPMAFQEKPPSTINATKSHQEKNGRRFQRTESKPSAPKNTIPPLSCWETAERRWWPLDSLSCGWFRRQENLKLKRGVLGASQEGALFNIDSKAKDQQQWHKNPAQLAGKELFELLTR